jgi:hypothetical protein
VGTELCEIASQVWNTGGGIDGVSSETSLLLHWLVITFFICILTNPSAHTSTTYRNVCV